MRKLRQNIAVETLATTFSAGKERAIVITITPGGVVLNFRLKGTRTTYELPTVCAFREAALLTAEQRRSRPKRRPRIKRGH